MAVISTYLTAKKDTKANPTGAFLITKRIALPAAGVANGDNVQALVIPCGMRLVSAVAAQLATLGAGATVKAQLNRSGTRTDLTGATPGGAAGKAHSDTVATITPIDLQVDDVIELLIGGAGVTAAATVTLDLYVERL